jgi:DNA (cytosine-5)-methyltransferase 1
LTRIYYNEWDKDTAWWLSIIMKAGLIPEGDIDTRSIEDVRAEDLKGYTQCHFFAGIGGWSRALRLAGWSDDRPVWTGSPPCQSFSSAGAGKGFEDERDLWPVWFENLIRERKPPVIFGEEVARAVEFGWLDRAYYDLEKEGYAIGSQIVPACAVGAPHRRDRLWFCADRFMVDPSSDDAGRRSGKISSSSRRSRSKQGDMSQVSSSDLSCAGDALGYAQHDGQHAGQITGGSREGEGKSGMLELEGSSSWSVGDTLDARLEGHFRNGTRERDWKDTPRPAPSAGLSGFWDQHEWIKCGDGAHRRTPDAQSGVRLLAHGLPRKLVDLALKGMGNAIVPQVAALLIQDYMEYKS